MTDTAALQLENSLPQQTPTVRLRFPAQQLSHICEGLGFLACRYAEHNLGCSSAIHAYRVFTEIRPNDHVDREVVAEFLALRARLRARLEEGTNSYRLQANLIDCLILLLGARAWHKACLRSPQRKWTGKEKKSWRGLLKKLENARRRAKRAWVESESGESYDDFHHRWLAFLTWVDGYLLVNPEKFISLPWWRASRKLELDLLQEHAKQLLISQGIPVPEPAVLSKLIRKFRDRVRRHAVPGIGMKQLMAQTEAANERLVDFVTAGWARKRN